MNDIGTRISGLRKKKGLTQSELGRIMHVSDKTISSWESNRTEPSLNDIVVLSEVIDTTPTYLLYGNVEKLDLETEIKIRLDKKEYDYLNSYMKNNAKFLKTTTQVDTYYNPKHRSFIDDDVINEWLRIGLRGGKTILNYKHWYDNKYCDEYEVEIDDDKNMDRILSILGLEKICVVDKERTTYFYKDKYEIALDNVESLGYFIEIEVKKYELEKDPFKEYDDLLKLAVYLHLDLEKLDKRGYPYYLIRKQKEN